MANPVKEESKMKLRIVSNSFDGYMSPAKGGGGCCCNCHCCTIIMPVPIF